MLELEKKDFKMFTVTIFHLFRKLTKDTIKKNPNQISRDKIYNVLGEKYRRWGWG